MAKKEKQPPVGKVRIGSILKIYRLAHTHTLAVPFACAESGPSENEMVYGSEESGRNGTSHKRSHGNEKEILRRGEREK